MGLQNLRKDFKGQVADKWSARQIQLDSTFPFEGGFYSSQELKTGCPREMCLVKFLKD